MSYVETCPGCGWTRDHSIDCTTTKEVATVTEPKANPVNQHPGTPGDAAHQRSEAAPVNLFVYGTLRSWDSLGGVYFRPSEFESRRPATMPGKLYTLGAFPVMVEPIDGSYGEVVGEVITVKPPFDDLRDLQRMEVSAGYYIANRWARASGEAMSIPCLVFLYEPGNVRANWPRLPGDDFHRQHELPQVVIDSARYGNRDLVRSGQGEQDDLDWIPPVEQMNDPDYPSPYGH